MKTELKIKHFAELGEILVHISQNLHNNKYSQFIQKSQNSNTWFTNKSISFALSQIGKSLTKDNLNKWLAQYKISDSNNQKRIGLVLAGNIPLVGFHDILSSLITNNGVLVKLSSKDESLYKMIYAILTQIEPKYEQYIKFTDLQLKNIDAIIATGSNNSARYFERYFAKYPHIIRKNRNSIAILNGKENKQDYANLSVDVFTYFGLGCRNVSFLLLPQDFDIESLAKNLEQPDTMENTKYANNYSYQQAILLMNQSQFYDNGNLLLKQDESIASSISTLNYRHYKTKSDINNFIQKQSNNIQCVVSNEQTNFPTVGFGESQKPNLWDYADNIDTIKFLTALNK